MLFKLIFRKCCSKLVVSILSDFKRLHAVFEKCHKTNHPVDDTKYMQSVFEGYATIAMFDAMNQCSAMEHGGVTVLVKPQRGVIASKDHGPNKLTLLCVTNQLTVCTGVVKDSEQSLVVHIPQRGNLTFKCRAPVGPKATDDKEVRMVCPFFYAKALKPQLANMILGSMEITIDGGVKVQVPTWTNPRKICKGEEVFIPA